MILKGGAGVLPPDLKMCFEKVPGSLNPEPNSRSKLVAGTIIVKIVMNDIMIIMITIIVTYEVV